MPLLSGFALGVMSVLILIIARDFGRLTVAKIFIATIFAGACFLIDKHLPEQWRPYAADIYTTVPALFWLLCQQAFAHRPKILSISGIIALYTFVAPALARLFGINDQHLSEFVLIAWTLPTYCEYIIIFLGLWTVIENWADDLVESRRKLRGAVLIGVGVGVLLVVVPSNTGIARSWLPYLSISTITLICSYFLLQGQTGVLFGLYPNPTNTPDNIKVKVEPEKSVDPEFHALTQSLHRIMQEGFYRTEHLTLRALALKLELPEYKTRALINQTLGYRNFNDYINQLRIEDAAQRLLDDLDTPILNISLDVGYRTLSSFNRAFKDIKQVSPSEYRQNMANKTD